MAERNIIVIGCSVGGVEALQRLVAPLPRDFPAALFVVLHLAPQSTSVLPHSRAPEPFRLCIPEMARRSAWGGSMLRRRTIIC